MMLLFRGACLLSFLSLTLSAYDGLAADKAVATLLVKDGLTSPHQPASIEARLVSQGLVTSAGMGGEPLELLIDGHVAATAMTGGDGRAVLSYTPKAQGISAVQVRVGDSPRVGPAEGRANLVVWERRNPIVAIEWSALVDESQAKNPLPGLVLKTESDRPPMPDAAEELAKLTQFYYHVMYVVSVVPGEDGFQKQAAVREWLKAHQFPAGYVVVLPPGEQAMGAKIDEWHAAGWRTVKTGIGRTKAFAEAFLQRRLDAVMVPEPAKGEAPRKAKIAKDWKEIRKKL